MKISIITTCRNRAGTIGQAIESVLCQQGVEIELIVIDGASTDGSQDVIARYSDRLARMVSEPDGGVYDAINKGIRMATGDVIGLVHSDDVLEDSRTLQQIERQMTQTQADLLYGDGCFVSADNPAKVVRRWHSGRYSKRKVRHGWLPLHPAVYIRRDVMERMGLYDESYRIAADSDLLVRYLLEADLKVTYLEQRIVRMRMGGLSTDHRKRWLMWKEDVRMYRSHGLNGTWTKILKVARKLPQFI